MSLLYVEQSLAPDEKLVHIGRFHWFYDVQAFMNIVWGLFFAISILIAAIQLEPYLPGSMTIMTSPLLVQDSWLTQLQKLHAGIKLFAFLVVMLGIFKFAQMLVIKITTEVAVTTTRLIYKRGLVARYVGEMNVDRIEGVSVMQTFWGRIFNFGRVVVRGMGVGEMLLPQLSDPLTMRRAIEKARILHEKQDRGEKI
jgi:uncharacterized membrane protein YdbT with pleckstrin-like domain